MITRIDQTVGKVLALLRELRIDQDTLVFYTSDNGPNRQFVGPLNSNGGLRGIKRDLFEGGLRAAMVAWWPGTIDAGVTSDFVWDMRDFFPTVCQLAEVEPPDHLDGMSVLPTLLGKSQSQRPFHYWEYHSPFQQAVRMGHWKGIRFGTQEPLMLFHLERDVRESQDVANEHPEIVARIERHMATARTPSKYFP